MKSPTKSDIQTMRVVTACVAQLRDEAKFMGEAPADPEIKKFVARYGVTRARLLRLASFGMLEVSSEGWGRVVFRINPDWKKYL